MSQTLWNCIQICSDTDTASPVEGWGVHWVLATVLQEGLYWGPTGELRRHKVVAQGRGAEEVRIGCLWGQLQLQGTVPTHLNFSALEFRSPTHTWGSPHPAPGLSAGVGVGRRVVMVKSFRSLPSRGLLQVEEVEQGEENDGAGSGSSCPPSPWGRS